jgi:ascorbate-specific PTS system EIIC-type component UlaA
MHQGDIVARKVNNTLVTSPEKYEFVKLQIEQALEIYRAQLSMLLQSLTAFIVGDMTLIGFAVNQRNASMILLGTAFPMVAFYIIKKTNEILVSMLFTAVSLEQKYGGDDDWLASTLLAVANSPEALADMKSVATESNFETRIRRLKKASAPPFRKGVGLIRSLLVLAIIGQIIAPIFLTVYFQWKLF